MNDNHLSSTMAQMSASLGPFGPGVFGPALDENRRAVRATHQRLRTREERRGADPDGDLAESSGTEEERLDPAQQPVLQRQVRRALARPTQGDQLLFEQKVLRDHRAHAPGPHSFAVTTATCSKASRRSVMRESA